MARVLPAVRLRPAAGDALLRGPSQVAPADETVDAVGALHGVSFLSVAFASDPKSSRVLKQCQVEDLP